MQADTPVRHGNKSNIILVGPMGAGKTTVGRLLADMLQLSFVDTDHEIERRTGASIPWIFDKEGEAGFRVRESQVIDAVTQQSSQVIATGGGAVLDARNRANMAARGTVVYLYAPVSMQLARTHCDRNRPLLHVGNPHAKLTELLTIRDPLYREVCHYVVHTTDGSARELAHKIVQMLGLSRVSNKLF